MIQFRLGWAAAALLVLLSGCLPYSCRREESTDLMPADSLSREIAATVSVDTLALDWALGTISDRPLEHPRTVRFGPAASDTIYVSDAEAGAVFVVNTHGDALATVETVDVPYLAGVRGDTVAVFDPAGPALHLVAGGRTVDTLHIRDEEKPRTALVYAAFNGNVFYKRVDADAGSFVADISRDGQLGARRRLNGPHWRHAGLLRVWGDSLLSLSGFRPVVDLVTADGAVDTLALQGFDSPMLARSRSFIVGEIHEPPLLSASAAALGDRLFVLNMRAGWLQIDVFDQTGNLVRTLTENARAYRRAYFPQDLDVRRRADGSYAVAVVLTAPEPELRLYTWREP